MASESKGYSGTQLEYSYTFGLKGDVKNNVEYLEENVVVYPCGHSLVHFNTESRVQQFVAGSPNSHGITAMATTKSKRCVCVLDLCVGCGCWTACHRCGESCWRVVFANLTLFVRLRLWVFAPDSLRTPRAASDPVSLCSSGPP